MTAHHPAEDTALARLNVVLPGQRPFDLTLLSLVLRNRGPIDEKNPVQIAAGCHLFTCDRPEGDHTRVRGVAVAKEIFEIASKRSCIGPDLSDRRPIGAEASFENPDVRRLRGHRLFYRTMRLGRLLGRRRQY